MTYHKALLNGLGEEYIKPTLQALHNLRCEAHSLCNIRPRGDQWEADAIGCQCDNSTNKDS